ncbi:MAG: thioredoxin-like domain-containing protein [Bacteroides sp.]|nr:thioredoxin-like domain-containing protein [Bacteroides sp.]
MKKIIACSTLALTLMVSCSNEPKFTVSGKIADAKDKMLYIDNMGIAEITTIDSVKLSESGEYKFHGVRPESPEFYRLRMENKHINFSIDSTEHITINSQNEGFATNYQVEGSENNVKIKELTLKLADLQSRLEALAKDGNEGKITVEEYQKSVVAQVEAYKDEVRKEYILSNPESAVAYFALFQRINQLMVFDPYNDKMDIRTFGAVATTYDRKYPNAVRTKNLHNIALKGLKNKRQTSKPATEEETRKVEVESVGIIDIDLKDVKGNVKKVSELKGKTVLLVFTAYQQQNSGAHNLLLRDLYKKYAQRGLEIYQVSFDIDEHLWKSSAVRMPWICVRDPRGTYSSLINTYNITQLPTMFLIDKNNELKSRVEDVKNLEKEVEKLL